MRHLLTVALTAICLQLLSSAAVAVSPISGFVPVPGGRLFYEEQGTGPAVVLIHGGMLDHRMWDPQVGVLARDHRVIRYDAAGHGRSPVPEQPWKTYEHLGLLLEALKVDNASLVGLSMGGRIAVDFAIAHPEKVRSLVLVDPGISGFPFTGRDFMARQGESYRARMARDSVKVAEVFLGSWLAGPHRTPSQVDPGVWAKALEMAIPNALQSAAGEELKPPAVGRLNEIQAPVLLIEGELDCEDIHRITRLIEHRIGGARRVVIPGVAHMPNLERPDEVNRLLVEFLHEPPAPPPQHPPQAVEEMVEVEGGRLWAERTGDGEPVVLIHDGIVHAVGWDEVLPALASQFEVIRYDRRGYGRSTTPRAPFSHLADLEAVLRHFSVGKAHLVASSAGGELAIDFALAHPEQVSSLTLVGAIVSGFPFTGHFASRGGRLTQALFADSVQFRRYWSTTDPYFIAPDSKVVRERVAAILEAFPQNLSPGKGRFEMRSSSPALPRLSSIRAPTLVVVGEHDVPDVHTHAGAIAAGIPHARRDVMADCGHVAYLEQPEAFVDRVLPFLQSAPFLGVLDNQGAPAAAEMLRAAQAADPAAVLVSEDELNGRGYQLLAAGATPEAIAVFRLGTQAFPASANTHDSLGEALLAAEDRAGATAEYRRALEIDPASPSARAALERLGALPK